MLLDYHAIFRDTNQKCYPKNYSLLTTSPPSYELQVYTGLSWYPNFLFHSASRKPVREPQGPKQPCRQSEVQPRSRIGHGVHKDGRLVVSAKILGGIKLKHASRMVIETHREWLLKDMRLAQPLARLVTFSTGVLAGLAASINEKSRKSEHWQANSRWRVEPKQLKTF